MVARLFEDGMIRVQRGPDRQSLIAGRRLNIGSAERRVIKQLAVGYAIERASACHSQVFKRNASVKLIQQMEEDFLKTMLQGESQIHVALRDLGVGATRFAEQVLHALGEMTRQLHCAVR